MSVYEPYLLLYYNNKKDYNKHIMTLKHINNIPVEINKPKESEPVIFPCKNCNTIYYSRVGLWKHKKNVYHKLMK